VYIPRAAEIVVLSLAGERFTRYVDAAAAV
jgi:hypothetical protein